MTVNREGNLEAHLNAVNGKVEAALPTIFYMAGNEEFRIVEMATIWKLVHTCIIPILTYGAETWMPTKAELTQEIINLQIYEMLCEITVLYNTLMYLNYSRLSCTGLYD